MSRTFRRWAKQATKPDLIQEGEYVYHTQGKHWKLCRIDVIDSFDVSVIPVDGHEPFGTKRWYLRRVPELMQGAA